MARKAKVEEMKLGDEQVVVTQNTGPEISEEKLQEAQFERPDITSPLWHEFVMMKFDDAEIDANGYPRVSGLRRVTEELLGDIVVSEPFVIADGPDRCAIKHTIEIKFPAEEMPRRFSEVADATPANVGNDNKIIHFLLSTASTRAEARALRKALRLRVLSSEEASLADKTGGQLTSDVSNQETYIHPSQITNLELMCKRNNIDLWKYINQTCFTDEMKQGKYITVEKIPYVCAQKMLRYLTRIQTKSLAAPEGATGFDPQWRKTAKGVV
jgi:hypothetical protein